jgi:hypothetical protein
MATYTRKRSKTYKTRKYTIRKTVTVTKSVKRRKR